MLTAVAKLGNHQRGFTLMELLFAAIIVGVLTAIAVPSYQSSVERARVNEAIRDIAQIDAQLQQQYTVNFSYPNTLVEVGLDRTDPWGNPYQYLNIQTQKSKGGLRKDKNLNPLNTDFDLYSKGKDGRSVSPLTAKHSRDDIVRAGNGGFVGLAEDH